MKLFENCLCLPQCLRWESHIEESWSKAFSEKKVPCMEMWVKSDYLRVFLSFLQPISRPIFFLSLNKQPISLARSHNWLPLLSQTAVPYCSAPCDRIQSTPQPITVHSCLADRKLGVRWTLCLFCVKTTKCPAASTTLLRSLRIDYCETAAIISPLIVIGRYNQICPHSWCLLGK